MEDKKFISESLFESIKVIALNNPPVNALNEALCFELHESIKKALEDESCEAIIITSDNKIFSAGADINDFDSENYEPFFPPMLDHIENANKPIIAALNGSALGGGFELALACHYRVAHKDIKVGLPEVHLGLIPGAGGTQRLPRLVGIPKALELTISGKPTQAKLIEVAFDKLSESAEEVISSAMALAQEHIDEKRSIPRTQQRSLDKGAETQKQLLSFKQEVANKYKGRIAPESCVTAIEAALSSESFSDGQLVEQNLFLKCLGSSESKSLIHLFLSERFTSQVIDYDKTTSTREINQVAIIGAGLMGTGIAMNFLAVNIPVILLDVREKALETGVSAIKANFERLVSKGRMTKNTAVEKLGLLTQTSSYHELSEVDLVIEAVFEKLSLKQDVFKNLDSVCKPGAILATNTSSLDINEIAAVTQRPEDVIGLHFFSPANVMKLLEIVKTNKTSASTIKTCMKLSKQIRKVGVLVGVCFGFVGNRMIESYIREANRLVLDGATPKQIDDVACEFGFPMGPFTMTDMAGLDVGKFVRDSRPELISKDPTYCAFADALVEQGRIGIKAGKGNYKYEENSRKPMPDQAVIAIINSTRAKYGIEQRDISNEEILDRLLYPLINEGLQILQEEVASKPSDIDIIYVFGYGFPSHHGGPMHWADHIGISKIYDRMQSYQRELGDYGQKWFTTSSLLKQLVETGRTIGSLQKNQLSRN